MSNKTIEIKSLLRLIIVVLSISLGIIFFNEGEGIIDKINNSQIPSVVISGIIAATLFLFALGFAIWSFLRGDFDKFIADGVLTTEIIANGIFGDVENSRIKKLTKNVESLEKNVNIILGKSFNSKGLDAGTVKEILVKEFQNTFNERVINDLKARFSKEFINDKRGSEIDLQLLYTVQRLNKEITSLGRRNIVNLTIGIVITLGAAYFLVYTVSSVNQSYENLTELLAHYIPRVTTIIFIEVFAFFFLKLYKTGLKDIKYFQNELTNIELQTVAIKTSFLTEKSNSTEKVIEQLIKTDRNALTINKSDNDLDDSLKIKDLKSLVEVASKVTGKG